MAQWPSRALGVSRKIERIENFLLFRTKMIDLVIFKELLKCDRAIKVGNVGYDLVGFMSMCVGYDTLITCVHLPKIMQFYIINVFKFLTTGCLLATILLSLSQW